MVTGVTPLVCGGETRDPSAHAVSDCYAFNMTANEWTHMGKMKEKRYDMGYSVHPNRGLFLAGGVKPSRELVQSTLDGSTFSQHDDMPGTSYSKEEPY